MFAHIVVVLLFFLLVPLLASDCQDAVGEFHVNILLFHTRQFGRDLIAFIGLRDVDRRHCAKGSLRSPERLDIEKRTSEW